MDGTPGEEDKSRGDPLAGDGGTRVMQTIKSDFSLVDVFRALYRARRLFSFSARGVSTRLDRFYVSSVVVGRVDIPHSLYHYGPQHRRNDLRGWSF